jgi:ABC-type glycerol-3-phosphate transport system substrate-binding protein
MKRRTFLAGTAATALARPAIAQSSKKLTFLSWNIVDQADMFKRWFAAFTAEHPGVEIEWLDKMGPDLPQARRPTCWICRAASASNTPRRARCST